GGQAQGRLSSTIAFTKNRTAKKIVQRLRLRSTIDPPPSGPVPLPTPKAPDRPESLPECISTRKMTITAMATSRTERTVSTRRRLARGEAHGHGTRAAALVEVRSEKWKSAAKRNPPAGQ